MVELENEQAERLVPRFHLEHAYQPHPGGLALGYPPQIFRDVQNLWVEVHNDGPDGRFSAQIRNVVGTDNPSYQVDEVAWENTIDRFYEIPGGNRARLRVGSVSHDPVAFWMWIAQSATWASGAQGAGTRTSHFDQIIDFDLIVTNSTAAKSVTKRMRVTFDDERRVNGFGFAEEPTQPIPDTQEPQTGKDE
jgi:hypothetical protein